MMSKKQTDNNSSNIHGSAVVVGETGVLIIGPSGSGKSRLAMNFIQSARAVGTYAALVGDDQLWLHHCNGRTIATVPRATRGLIEVRGSAILSTPYQHRAVIHVVVRLPGAGEGDRLPAADNQFAGPGDTFLPLLQIVPGQLQNPYELLLAYTENRLLR